MTISNDRTKLIDKVVKLLALAEGTDHTPEAEAARNMAAELMAKHNISFAEAVQKDPLGRKEERLNTKKPPTFETDLLTGISTFNGVAMIYTSGGGEAASYTFVGRSQDIEATEYMRDIILNQRKAAYDKWRAEYLAETGVKVVRNQTPVLWLAWNNGFTSGVCKKLRELRKMSEQKVQEWGLVPVDPKAVALKWYKENGGSCRTAKSQREAGSADGFAAGRGVSLNKGITKQHGVKAIGG